MMNRIEKAELADLLDEAAEEFETRPLLRSGSFGDYEQPGSPVCTLGAVRAAAYKDNGDGSLISDMRVFGAHIELEKTLRDKKKGWPGSNLFLWNDKGSRDKRRAQRLLRATAKRLRKESGL